MKIQSGAHHVLLRQRIYIHINSYKVVRDEARKNRPERSNDYRDAGSSAATVPRILQDSCYFGEIDIYVSAYIC
jgi:hypothetical protein